MFENCEMVLSCGLMNHHFKISVFRIGIEGETIRSEVCKHCEGEKLIEACGNPRAPHPLYETLHGETSVGACLSYGVYNCVRAQDEYY